MFLFPIIDNFFQMCAREGTDIGDKVRGSANTQTLMKALNATELTETLASPRLEDVSSAMTVETPLSHQDKMVLDVPLRLSLTLECDMYESDVMLDTLSDTSM